MLVLGLIVPNGFDSENKLAPWEIGYGGGTGGIYLYIFLVKIDYVPGLLNKLGWSAGFTYYIFFCYWIFVWFSLPPNILTFGGSPLKIGLVIRLLVCGEFTKIDPPLITYFSPLPCGILNKLFSLGFGPVWLVKTAENILLFLV